MKYIILLLLSLYSYFQAPKIMNKEFMIFELLIVAVAIFSFFKDTKNLANQNRLYIRHVYFFIFVFIVVFYQCDIDYIVGFLDGNEYRIWISNTVVCKSMALSNISLISLMLGYSMYKYDISNQVGSKLNNRIYQSKKKLCYLAYILFAYFLIRVDSRFLSGGYVDSGGQVDGSFGVIVLLQAFIVAILVLYSIEFKENGYTNIKFYFKYPFILIALYCSIVLLSGRRTEVLRVLTMLIICICFLRGRELNYKKMTIAGVLCIVFFALFGIVRGSEGESVSVGIDVLKNKATIFPPTQELAGSVRTLHIASYYIPEMMPYNYGFTFFPSFTLLVPGLDRLCHAIFPHNWLITSPSYITSLYWDGQQGGYGLGSSIVADVYISFGMIGLIIVFFFIGRLLKYLEIRTFICENVSPYVLSLSFCVFSQITYSMRTGVSVLFLSWTYSCIFIYLVERHRKKC